jgi:hypothetical protein
VPCRPDRRTDQLPAGLVGSLTTHSDHNVQRSVTSSGSNARLRRFLHKLRSGKPVKVSVLGGSVSLGQNIPNSEQSPDIMFASLPSPFYLSYL